MRATEAHFRSLAWQSFTQIHVGASFVESYVPALHPVDRTSWEQTWEQAVNSGEPYALERRVRFLPQASYVCQLEWGKPLLENGSRTGDWEFTQLARFIDDLFELARSQNAQIKLRRTAVDLRATVQAAVEAAQPVIAARGQRLTVVVPEQSTLVNGDDGRLAQVFMPASELRVTC